MRVEGQRAGVSNHPVMDPNERSVAIRASRVRARLVFILLDTVCVLAGYGLAEVIYFRNKAPTDYLHNFVVFALMAVATTLLSNHVFGLYARMWRHAGAQEARQLLLSTSVCEAVLLVYVGIWRVFDVMLVPLSVVVVGALFAVIGMGTLRFHSRLFAWQRGSKQNVGLRMAIVGGHDSGAAAIREMQRCPSAGLIPVAVFDDDVRTHGLSLLGVPVIGGIEHIPDAASRYTLQQVLLTVPSPQPELVERVLRACELADISMKVLPGVHNLMSLPTHLATIRMAREPNIEDLLGRTPVSAELEPLRPTIEGRRVLVTGAGGSIGSEICRQVAGLNPEHLVLLDHDETHLHDTIATITGTCFQALVDITDRAAVFDTFARYRPEIVLHAAAHKHVPVLEEYPIAAVNTNIFGTLNVVEASAAVGTMRFVQISTDKAVRPSSVMGASKRLAEQIMLAHSPAGATYCAVRFGNVLGSRGSVIPTFARQIAAGGPVTVTDPRMTRFFMSVEEAVQLVLQASMLSEGREIFMLDMGEPVKILELAERMIRLSGYRVGDDIAIQIVGQRPGEKLDEELCTPEEHVSSTSHRHIQRLAPITMPADLLELRLKELEASANRRDADAVRSLLFESVSANEVDETRVEMEISPPIDYAKVPEAATALHHRHNGSVAGARRRSLDVVPSPISGGDG
jgi:FlaA1/EpsC-like NDP-sugar epimerase